MTAAVRAKGAAARAALREAGEREEDEQL